LRALGVDRLYLFGSVVRGDDRSDSDIDIFFDPKKPIGLEFVRIQDRIRELTAAEADVTTRGGLHPDLRSRIEMSALRVF
jgi:predicted nucleotidyltransferase